MIPVDTFFASGIVLLRTFTLLAIIYALAIVFICEVVPRGNRKPFFIGGFVASVVLAALVERIL